MYFRLLQHQIFFASSNNADISDMFSSSTIVVVEVLRFRIHKYVFVCPMCTFSAFSVLLSDNDLDDHQVLSSCAFFMFYKRKNVF